MGSTYNLAHYCVPGPPGEEQRFWLRGANQDVPEGWEACSRAEGASRLLCRPPATWPLGSPPPTYFAAPLYRIRRVPHHRTGDAWCIYPMYDWAHGQSDSLEGVTHSLCSLEFDTHRPLYD